MAMMGTMAGSMPQPYPPLPASPTLTNPDMILPDYDRSSSPLDDDDRSHSPLTMWKNARAATSGPDLGQLYSAPASQHAFSIPAAPMTPTTPIIYGNGTMLSDIGEVTEAESTPGKSPSRRRHEPPQHMLIERESLVDAALRSSPTMGVESSIKMRAKQQASQERLRRASIDSNSTITTQDQAGLFADFDDTVSVGESAFQGDDEESVADSYADNDSPVRPVYDESRLTVPTEPSGGSSGNASSNEDPQSTASLSRRAEQILANAKKRLTTMEGNLSRARNTLIVSSPSAVSFTSDGSTPSPPIQLRSSMILRDGHEASQGYSPGHARMGSDNALRIGLPVNVYPPRSASALGAAGGYRQPLTLSKSVDQIREQLTGGYTRPHYKISSTRDTGLEPLSEDEALSSPDMQPTNHRTSAQLESFLSPTFGPGEKGLVRSASVTQMRDLKDQMMDLKGKISSLREQARADSLKRRSLQSLRTPSPFTHAQGEPWSREPTSTQDAESSGKSGSGRNPWNGELSSVDGGENSRDANGAIDADEESVLSGYEEVSNGVTELTHPDQHFTESPVIPDMVAMPDADAQEQDDDDMRTENGDAEDEDNIPDEAYESESGESSYHDTLQHPVSHEDREDAFDYEHFILHSALGTISQQLARHASRDSFSSEDSVETTRGPIVESKGAKDGAKNRGSVIRRSRRGSAASTSTVESFATATEGRVSRTNRSSSGSDEAGKHYPVQLVDLPSPTGPESPLTAKRTSFGTGINGTNGNQKRNSAEEPRQTQRPLMTRRPASSAAAMLHRPSISSFESTGTNRSFPLVTKKPLSDILTPNASSPDDELKSISETLMNETASICEQAADDGRRETPSRGASSLGRNENMPATMQTLHKDDQFLVERLVASLGRCVLGLTDSGKASTENRMYRRRIDAARRILEGVDAV